MMRKQLITTAKPFRSFRRANVGREGGKIVVLQAYEAQAALPGFLAKEAQS